MPTLPGDVPQPLDAELLAWAAGFFDGEGSTIAKNEKRRPDYYQLDVSVPQAYRDGVPEVLTKFQRAVLGVGKIYPQHRDNLYKWSAGGRLAAELALGLMWPWLGTVKREQALVAIKRVDRQYAEGRHGLRPPRVRPTYVAHDLSHANQDPRVDLAWAAGFLDAEGWFGLAKSYTRSDGSIGYVLRASATQNGQPNMPAEVLIKLQSILEGRIERHGEIDDFKWVTEGSVNVGHVLEEVRRWLGPVKTKQAESALETALTARVRGDAERCKRGHLYDRIYVKANGGIHRICNTCDRLNDKAKRVAAGSKPRVLKNVPLDPTRTYMH